MGYIYKHNYMMLCLIKVNSSIKRINITAITESKHHYLVIWQQRCQTW